MNFKDSNSIYQQIAERICDEILLEKYRAEERIPSVRESAANLEVNPNTVARAYDYLQGNEVIYNKRGVGYFVAADAKKMVRKVRRKNFMNEVLPEFFRNLQLLDIPFEEVKERYEDYIADGN